MGPLHGNAWVASWHDSWFLPGTVKPAKSFMMSFQKSHSVISTMPYGYTGQPYSVWKGDYTRAWIPECGCHWGAILEAGYYSSHGSSVSSNLGQISLSWTGHFQRVLASYSVDVSPYGFVWCCIMISLHLFIFGKKTVEVTPCSLSASHQMVLMSVCIITVLLT